MTACESQTPHFFFYGLFSIKITLWKHIIMLKGIQIKAGLGDPPAKYTNSACKSANAQTKE